MPDQFSLSLLEVAPSEAIVRPRATVIPAGDSPDADLHMPALDQGAASNMFGGVQVDWIGEGDEKPETSAKIREVVQILLATHSPVILGIAEASQVLCFAKSKDPEGAVDIVPGSEHPGLREWRGQVGLGVLFASGVLG